LCFRQFSFSSVGQATAPAVAFLFLISTASADGPSAFDGYTAQSTPGEREWEVRLRAATSADNQREYMRRITARPHHVGSAYDKDNAEWILSKFREWGYDAHIEAFDVLFPTPRERALELTEPVRFTAKLSEPALAGDPTSNQTTEQLPTYNAYSADGDVTAPLVYVNYGMPADYDELQRLGISVKGAIAIARYGKGWRGVKVKVAAEHGALGCIIYSDPRDDGYSAGEVFPAGAFRPPEGVQRGSVMDTDYPGDPLTPGYASVPGAKRLALKDASTITKIPVLPISYADAQPLLAHIGARVAPESWRGSLPITYHVGPGPAKVHLKVTSNWDLKPVYDVIAKLPGSTFSDEWVLRGNHHDAWVNGAEDPAAGLVAMLEEARAFGELAKQGWRPKRTIVFCAWDGEEPGLLGSTEWVEAHADDLLHHAVAYFNSDTNGRGYFDADGSHTLEKLINSVTRDITDPETGASLWQRHFAHEIVDNKKSEDVADIRKRTDWRIGALGDGSDYTAFMHHLGIPSADIGFGGESRGGIYHSIYDDFYWYTHFGDPQFAYGRALSQTAGTIVMRIADADLLPLDFTAFADTVQMYITNVRKLVDREQANLREIDHQIQEGLFKQTSDPLRPTLPPEYRDAPQHFEFAKLQNAADVLTHSAETFGKATARLLESGTALDHDALVRINAILMQAGPALTDPAGLPHRPWFKNQIYAPGAYTGYESKPLPGIQEAMDRRNWAEAESQIPREAEALVREAAVIDRASAEIARVTSHTTAGFALMGGGDDQDEAFRWMCDRAGAGGRFVVLRASGDDDYNPYIRGLCPALSSVETIIIKSRQTALDPSVADRIDHAQALFIAGGDQANYINFWTGTPVQSAINNLIGRGVPLGGTSAGLAVLAQYNFSALRDTVTSAEALANPYDERVTVGRDFLHVPHLEARITDSHFKARDRMGRLLVFLARIGPGSGGIAVDEKTAVLMDGDGNARVVGESAAWFVRAPSTPADCRAGAPLSWSNISVYRLPAGKGSFNLSTWTGEGGTAYSLSVDHGAVRSTQPGGSLY
jgi:N-acetylated-alpha-linked acidic dipeptidase